MKDKHFDYEEDFHKKDPKEFKKERKILSKKDRSKFKKTDLDKLKKNVPTNKDLLRGRVLAIMADGILVDSEDQLYNCSLRGALKKENLQIKNLVAVGDFVLFKPSGENTGSIAYIEERTSILSRASQLHRRKEQLIAVNIDQVLITSSVVLPPLKPPLIDRYIIATLKGNMDPVIVINKIDLLEEGSEEKKLYEEVLTIYQKLNIPTLPISAKTGEGMDALKEIMKGKSSVFSGQSGTGKTCLINEITGSSFRTGEVIARTRKGAHTTTSTQLLPVDGEGFCIDTPGIKSFGLWNIKKEDVREYFFEVNEFAAQCKFPDCSHIQEPDCAVKKALEDGEISRLRFESYCAIILGLNTNTKR